MAIVIQRHISSPHLKSIISYWQALRHDRPAPQVSEVDPVDIPRAALPFVVLSDVCHGPFRIRYRLAGSHSTELGAIYSGMYMDQLGLPADLYDLLLEDYAYSARTCEPVVGSYPFPKLDGSSVTVEYVLLPLLSDDCVVRFLCGEHVLDEAFGEFLQGGDFKQFLPHRKTPSQ